MLSLRENSLNVVALSYVNAPPRYVIPSPQAVSAWMPHVESTGDPKHRCYRSSTLVRHDSKLHDQSVHLPRHMIQIQRLDVVHEDDPTAHTRPQFDHEFQLCHRGYSPVHANDSYPTSHSQCRDRATARPIESGHVQRLRHSTDQAPIDDDRESAHNLPSPKPIQGELDTDHCLD